MDAYKKNYTKDTKSLNLARRRSKLTSLYHDESLQYEVSHGQAIHSLLQSVYSYCIFAFV